MAPKKKKNEKKVETNETEEVPRLPPHIEKQRRMLTLRSEGPAHANTHEYSGLYASLGIDNSFHLKRHKRNFRMEFKKDALTLAEGGDTLTFDVVGVDPAIANAYRRVMLAEIPTVCIETVTMFQNTGVLQDELLCQRIGLVPLLIDSDKIEFRQQNQEVTAATGVHFSLKMTCTRGTLSVYSRDLVWTPQSDAERQKWKDAPPKPVLPNILLTKIRPGQEIDLIAVAEKGLAKEHAKWSPVATATYRLQPYIDFPSGSVLPAETAESLVQSCKVGVFELATPPPPAASSSSSSAKSAGAPMDIEDGAEGGVREVRVTDPLRCTSCRNCFEQLPGVVEVNKIKDHFIFTVESVGSLSCDKIVRDASKVLIQKCEDLLVEIEALENSSQFGQEGVEGGEAQVFLGRAETGEAGSSSSSSSSSSASLQQTGDAQKGKKGAGGGKRKGRG
uniref:DNA-directed RNA polymerase RpoA/D/Rpb3-type domain-containing protein n=1 Tax=Chromera velia CCMP2878 TaxID=1169474 RepID=A0A0G4HYU1_9ALVE|mmetsp:Transcript_5581/g.11056  ORF Transcript_5581/g.11056 Transcript_5581/m.11056 type:complete len:447 (+) Transcript_5581:163-1503(+)|eukprot:Cvel_9564.t1-p1 / transcript=Cvel_9564.t1 / gene=Cvel_9564 / organism=Chromera_velia_CCMP2878 / gene_product=DNA-directed RNA polymerases I and III subunit, putative / transcript_product=DNA-directed RNA polymerases I and III subunit, putative / location=Cvel_scaffold554:42840-49567(+) / protein_length=446 / sequence_SO=supercontig / SO=protein_coding / is_pseudo=false